MKSRTLILPAAALAAMAFATVALAQATPPTPAKVISTATPGSGSGFGGKATAIGAITATTAAAPSGAAERVTGATAAQVKPGLEASTDAGNTGSGQARAISVKTER